MNRIWTLAGTLALGVLTAALFRDTLLWIARQWLSNDYYAHGMLIPFVSAILLGRRWDRWRCRCHPEAVLLPRPPLT